jgi:hypothetical protein
LLKPSSQRINSTPGPVKAVVGRGMIQMLFSVSIVGKACRPLFF